MNWTFNMDISGVLLLFFYLGLQPIKIISLIWAESIGRWGKTGDPRENKQI